MIKIEEYEVIGFIKWLEKANSYNDIEDLVESYLRENCKKWNFKLFIKLYQDYLMNKIVSNPDLNYIEIFSRFCESIESLKYIQIETIDKNPYLQPIFYNFVDYLKRENIYQNINEQLIYIAREVHLNEYAFIEWFEIIINNYSQELIYHFNIYMRNSLHMSYQYQFERWVEKNRYKLFGEVISFEQFNRNNRKRLLTEVANSRVFRLDEDEQTKFPKFIIMNDEPEYIDFISYVDSKNLRIEKSIPPHILEQLIAEYCDQNPNVKRRGLKKFVNKILKNKFLLMRILEEKMNTTGKMFDIERYYECKNHGILLFRKVDKFKEFLNDYLEDLHNLTRDTLDIYFTQEDLKRNVSSYERIERLCHLKVEKGLVPCFLIWSHTSDKIEVISLEDLSHEDIYKVIREVVTELEKNDFDESISKGIEKAAFIKKEKKGNVCYDLRNSQIGAVGDGAIALRPTFEKNN